MVSSAQPKLYRRAVLQGGLAGLAMVLSRSLVACSKTSGDAGVPALDATEGGVDTAIGEDLGYVGPPRPKLVSAIAAIGPLGAPDANGVRVPDGFTARIVGKSSKPPIDGKDLLWHSAPDGGATFPTDDGGWIYVSNSELPLAGGVGALRFDAEGKLVDAYRILEGTNVNCAGGPTPWNTWLSCEEVYNGRVYECDPRGQQTAIVRPALGTFKHEAAAVDPLLHRVYLTEDEPDGCFYRFVPDGLGKHGFASLASGKLEVAQVAADGKVTWHTLPDPTFEGDVPTREQVPMATHFDGGEGIWWHDGVVYFTTKGDDRVRAYDTRSERVSVLYDARSDPNPVLTGVDNVTVSASGDVLVAEDGGDMQIVAILPSGELKPLVQLVDYPDSEITGPAFDPSGTRLYFSSQRGRKGGTTFEITGPFHAPA